MRKQELSARNGAPATIGPKQWCARGAPRRGARPLFVHAEERGYAWRTRRSDLAKPAHGACGDDRCAFGGHRRCADVQRFYIPAHGSILAPSHGMTFSRDPPPVVLSTVESQNYSMSKPGKKSTRRPRCYRTVHKELGATVYTYSLPPSCFFHIGLARPRRVHRPERPTASRVCRPLT